LEDFLSENPRRSELYDALDFSRRISFQRSFDAFHGCIDEITDDEQTGYIATVGVAYAGAFIGTMVYLFVVLEIGLDWFWASYCLSCGLIAVLAGRATQGRGGLLDLHLQRFGDYSEELAAACVGQMKWVHETMSSRANWLLLEILAAPITAPCIVLLFATAPFPLSQNQG
jgi:hypothetical protein